MAYNNSFVSFSSVEDGSRIRVPLNRTYQIWGVGAVPMLCRNFLSAASVRAFSPWLQERLDVPRVGKATKATICDATGSVLSATLTAPAHQLFNFMATTPHAKSLARQERWTMARDFVYKQYFVPLPRESALEPEKFSWRVSSVAARDLSMRTMYVTVLFTSFMSIERTLCSMMRG